MPKRDDINTILVIGSGPIIIGQAAEFDYAGVQACLSLKEEGYRVVLINSNPATIMTDKEMADKIYMEPLTVEFLSQIIAMERPDALLSSLSGQIGLNLAIELNNNNILKNYEVELLGTSIRSISQAEDRKLFKKLMDTISEPTVKSVIVNDVEKALDFACSEGYPLVIRPAYTLGGTGGGIVTTEKELIEITTTGILNSPANQCLIEKCISGYKEIEYEVIRDRQDNAIVICNMENIDPVGIHTGDSIVVAPSQTLSDRDYHMLRDSALKIIRALKIEGGCNIQFALDPFSNNYYVIEVNPRVSRSSALASKATGYPIAKIAAKIAIGYSLYEMKNPITNTTYAGFEPALDYVVTKFPRFPFDKFQGADRRLGTQMKATGEVMAIGRNLEESILKSIQSLEIGRLHLLDESILALDLPSILDKLKIADDERIFIIAQAFRLGAGIQDIQQLTGIDPFFLCKIYNIVELEKELKANINNEDLLLKAKRHGFSDSIIAKLWDATFEDIYNLRKRINIKPVYKMVDSCAAEFVSDTPYFYSSYEYENESKRSSRKKILVLGSGPIRIGQGIEFDYATVHSVQALQSLGYEAIVINSNPETVSTDFSIADKLYFEPLSVEHVREIIELEEPDGVLVQFGGQTAINLAKSLGDSVNILGTSIANIDRAENREKFDKVLENLRIMRPRGYTVYKYEEAKVVANEIGYPVLIRPSYVLGGRAMKIVYEDYTLKEYMEEARKIDDNQPILIDKYINGTEVEMDVICDGQTVLIPGIMEHIEKAGVHSGDSIAVYPTQTVAETMKDILVKYAVKLAKGFNIVGLLNIQFIVTKEEVYVIEINPRSSRTIPFLSKVLGLPMAKIATAVILGKTLKELGYNEVLMQDRDEVFVKMPVFSFAKLRSVDATLGPEMKSTGEVIGRDSSYERALYKAMLAANIKIPYFGQAIFTLADEDKEQALELVRSIKKMGYTIFATEGTANYFNQGGIDAKIIRKVDDKAIGCDILSLIQSGRINFVVNTISKSSKSSKDGFMIRRVSVENNVACFTSMDTFAVLARVIENLGFSVKEF